MSLQFISDSKGQTTGVYIPINEWNALKRKFKDIELEEFDIPTWQMNEVRERIEDYKSNPDQTLDFDQSIDEIEKEL